MWDFQVDFCTLHSIPRFLTWKKNPQHEWVSLNPHIPKDEADGFGLVNGTDGYQKVEGNQATGAGLGSWR